MGYSMGYSPQVVAARVQRLVDDVRASAAVVKDLIFKSELDYVVLYSDATTMQPLQRRCNRCKHGDATAQRQMQRLHAQSSLPMPLRPPSRYYTLQYPTMSTLQYPTYSTLQYPRRCSCRSDDRV
jgi:hypothetical protein